MAAMTAKIGAFFASSLRAVFAGSLDHELTLSRGSGHLNRLLNDAQYVFSVRLC